MHLYNDSDVIGSYFFKDIAIRNLTDNIQALDLPDVRFQQDDATHWRVTMDYWEASSINILFHDRDRSKGYLDRVIKCI